MSVRHGELHVINDLDDKAATFVYHRSQDIKVYTRPIETTVADSLYAEG